MSDKCSSCASQGQCNIPPEECGQNDKGLMGSRNSIRNVIVVMSGKGGVGKSSVTGLLAHALAQSGKKVAILDADITGPSQPRAFGLQGSRLQATEYGIRPVVSAGGIKVISINFFLEREDEPVIWRGPMLAGAVNQFWNEVDWQELDYMIVDLPPGTGDVPLTVMQTLPVNGIVIVSSPQELVAMVVKKTIKMAQKMNVPILGLVENMSYAVCPHCGDKLNIFGENIGSQVAGECDIDFLGGLRWDLEFNQLVDKGRIEEYHSEDMPAIAAQIMQKLP